MKRRLALFLVLALVVSLIPANVFASSSNSMITVPVITDDEIFEVNDADTPDFRIEEGNLNDYKTTSQTFSLTLDNADWRSTDGTTATAAAFEAAMASQILANSNSGTAAVGTMTVEVSRISDSRIDVAITKTAGTADELWFKVPMAFKAGDEGDVKVTVDAKNTSLTSGTYTVAKIVGGDTTFTINDTTDFVDETALETMIIEEVVMGTLGATNEIKLKFTDSDFEWSAAPTITNAGAFTAHTYTVETVYANLGTGEYFIDGNILYIIPTGIAGATDTGSIVITGGVDPSGNDYGDVKVKVYGSDVTEETLVVGTYTDYAVTVEGDEDDDMVTIYSGEIGTDVSTAENTSWGTTAIATNTIQTAVDAATGDPEENELVTLVIDETVAQSWLTTRTTKIEFPDEVKIMDVDVESDTSNIGEAALQTILDAELTSDKWDTNEIEFSFTKTSTTATTDVWLTFYVSVEADFTGDIIATVTGSALENDTEVKLGEAVAPVAVDIETADVRIGVQDQETGKITITEAAAEQLAKGREITLTLESEVEWSSTPTVTVTEGDLTIDDVEKSGSVVTITIDDESTEASTIEISDMEVDVDRTVAEGDFNVAIGGNGLVMNYDTDGTDFRFDTDSLIDTAFVRVITPADADVKAAETVAFTIDAMEYKVGETVVTMDAAPFIDASNRTMLPLRAFANALGVADEDIVWNGTERSVVIFKGDAVVKVVIGEMSFMKNGVTVPMDTMAIIKDGRTFLPVRALGQALGADIGWDAATRTVTID